MTADQLGGACPVEPKDRTDSDCFIQDRAFFNPWVRLATRAARSTVQASDASGKSQHLCSRLLVTRPGGCWTGLMTTPSQRPDNDGPVAPPVPGALGGPADPVGR